MTSTGRSQWPISFRETPPSSRERRPEIPCEPTTTTAASRCRAMSIRVSATSSSSGTAYASAARPSERASSAPSSATLEACSRCARSTVSTVPRSGGITSIPSGSDVIGSVASPGSHTVAIRAGRPANSSAACRRAPFDSSEPSYATTTGAGSVGDTRLHQRALRLAHRPLLLERLDGVGDIDMERVHQVAAKGELYQRPHHLHVVGVRGHRVGGDHPAALGRQLEGDVELVVGVLLGEVEGDQRQGLLAFPDYLEAAGALDVLCERLGVLLHDLHGPAIA